MAKFKTMLFFDLETTGMIGFRDGLPFPRISEIGFHAIDRIEFLKSAKENKEPRISHQMNLPVNPKIDKEKGWWETKAKEISGITPELVENVYDLQAWIPCMTSFLQALPKPICLIAHNGIIFDFKIMKAEIMRVMNGNLYTVFPACTIWADSVRIIRNIEDRTQAKIKLKIIELEEDMALIEFDEFDRDVLEILDANESQYHTPPAKRAAVENSESVLHSPIYRMKIDGKTIEHQTSSDVIVDCRGQSIAPLKKCNSGAKRKLFPTQEKTPPGDLQTKSKQTSPSRPQRPKCTPILLSRVQESLILNEITCNGFRKRFTVKQKNNLIDCVRTSCDSVSLRNLYLDLFGAAPPGHHEALADCRATAKVCLQYGKDFVETADKMAEALDKTK